MPEKSADKQENFVLRIFKSCILKHLVALFSIVFLCGGTFAILRERQTVQAATIVQNQEDWEKKGEKITKNREDILTIQGDVSSTKETVDKMWRYMNPSGKE